MKLVIITRHLPPQIDAVGFHASQLAAVLAKKGMQITLITSTGPTAPSVHPSLEVRPLMISWGWHAMFCLVKTIRRLRPDLVHLQYVPHMYGRHGVNLAVAALPLLLRFGTRRPVITTCHELLSHRPADLKTGMLQLIYLLQAAFILGGSAKVVVPAQWQEAQLRRTYPWWAKKVRRSPAGAGILVPADISHHASHPKHLTLGTFGAGHPWWNYEMAMQVLKALLDQGIPARLLCIGDVQGNNPTRYGRLRELEQQWGLSRSVQWTGFCSSEQVSDYLREVDIFLAFQSSGITARSTAFITALAHGLPTVATRGPDADPWLLESGAFIAIDPNDLRAAVQATSHLAMDPDAHRELGRRALDFYQRHLSWEEIGRQFEAVVESVRP